MNFREKVKEVCEAKGITQKELAERLGITDISLNKTLRGDYPRLQSLELIAKALDISIKELFPNETDDSKPIVSEYVTCPACGAKLKITPMNKKLEYDRKRVFNCL
jgi:transcriptional regulator with XRE-family HTH domain